uniref:pyrroline-5-carboxylate reductase n=1 Tax=Timema californicum TaxID=61474 RepID=A0A7R9P376_TIMCA|nr:unnamed protein product [Timema californicum]
MGDNSEVKWFKQDPLSERVREDKRKSKKRDYNVCMFQSLGAEITTDNTLVPQRSEVVILAVKPHIIPSVLQDIHPFVGDKNLILSVAMGIPLRDIEKSLGISRFVTEIRDIKVCYRAKGYREGLLQSLGISRFVTEPSDIKSLGISRRFVTEPRDIEKVRYRAKGYREGLLQSLGISRRFVTEPRDIEKSLGIREGLLQSLGISRRFVTEPRDIEKVCYRAKGYREGDYRISMSDACLYCSRVSRQEHVWCASCPTHPQWCGARPQFMFAAMPPSSKDEAVTEKLLRAIGTCDKVAESMMDAITALSGAGPAYAYIMVEALADGGVKMGLPRDLSYRLAAQTILGAGQMIRDTRIHPGQLKDDVTSPGGTHHKILISCTIAGLHYLENHGFRAALIGAVEQATKRAEEVALAQTR